MLLRYRVNSRVSGDGPAARAAAVRRGAMGGDAVHRSVPDSSMVPGTTQPGLAIRRRATIVASDSGRPSSVVSASSTGMSNQEWMAHRHASLRSIDGVDSSATVCDPSNTHPRSCPVIA